MSHHFLLTAFGIGFFKEEKVHVQVKINSYNG